LKVERVVPRAFSREAYTRSIPTLPNIPFLLCLAVPAMITPGGVAYLPADLSKIPVPVDGNEVSWLVAFLRFCNVQNVPQIQEEI
jgi:hypothetical protein